MLNPHTIKFQNQIKIFFIAYIENNNFDEVLLTKSYKSISLQDKTLVIL